MAISRGTKVVIGAFIAIVVLVNGLWLYVQRGDEWFREKGERYLIIHADDAGMSHSVNRATIDAMENGIVSSTSIMVPCPWLPEIAEYARNHPEGDYGVHLTLNSEWETYRWGPIASREQVPSLLDKDGYFPSSSAAVTANARVAEVEIELRAQINRAKAFGIPISHLDTHTGVLLTRPDLLEAYINVGIEYDLPVLMIKSISPERKREYAGLAGDNAPKLIAHLQERKMPLLEEAYQFYAGSDFNDKKRIYLDRLRKLQPGVSEILIHCGYDDHELRAITGSSTLRDTDRRVFCDPQVIDEIKRLGIHVINWKQFREMMKSSAK